MKQFEYNMISVPNGTDGSELIKCLNNDGKLGWEVISMIQSSDRSHFNVLLKREILNENYIENEKN